MPAICVGSGRGAVGEVDRIHLGPLRFGRFTMLQHLHVGPHMLVRL